MVAVLVTLGILASGIAIASHDFTDVPDDHTFHGDIEWMAENNITFGCNPPANDRYCPSEDTNRGQMAAFMRRLAESGVVDAGTLDGMDSSAFVTAGSGVLGAVTVREVTEAWVFGANSTEASCLVGEQVISGGFDAGLLVVSVSGDHPVANGWEVSGTITVAGDVTAYALCADLG